MLLLAPGTPVTRHSRLTLPEIQQRLQATPHTVSLSPKRAILHVIQPGKGSNARQAILWFTPDPINGTQLLIHMQTRYTAALSRLVIVAALCGLALWAGLWARGMIAGLFGLAALAFLLLGQYERLTRQGLRVHLARIQELLDTN
jgi:hypothetical protein